MSNRLRFHTRFGAGGGNRIVAPVNTVIPVITGDAEVGETLTTDDGTWTGTPTAFSYQWRSAGVAVGLNQNTYAIVNSDGGHTITSTVTASKATGSAAATSLPTAAVTGATYVADAVHFDGSTWLSVAFPITGLGATSTTFIQSAWYKIALAGDGMYPFASYSGATMYCRFSIEGVHHVRLEVLDVDANSDILDAEDAGVEFDQWMNILVAYDQTDESKCKAFVNGVAALDAVFNMTGPISWVGETGFYFGQDGNDDANMVGDMADMYLALDQWIDLSNPANVAKFIAAGKPVDLGVAGATPTGVAPTFFFSGNAAGFILNKGTGGAASLHGSLTNASTSPSD